MKINANGFTSKNWCAAVTGIDAGAPPLRRNCPETARECRRLPAKLLKKMVGVRGFEPPTPSSRTMCATRLRYTPTPRPI
jgi:hypothetical protein